MSGRFRACRASAAFFYGGGPLPIEKIRALGYNQRQKRFYRGFPIPR